MHPLVSQTTPKTQTEIRHRNNAHSIQRPSQLEIITKIDCSNIQIRGRIPGRLKSHAANTMAPTTTRKYPTTRNPAKMIHDR